MTQPKSKSKPLYHWLVFSQSNTNGDFIHSDALSSYVAFRVDSSITPSNYYLNDELEQYFDSILFYPTNKYDTDCDCCGPRWQILQKTFSSHDSIRTFLNNKLFRQCIVFHNIPKNKITYWKDDSFNENILSLNQVEDIYLRKLYRDARYYDTDAYSYYKEVVLERRTKL